MITAEEMSKNIFPQEVILKDCENGWEVNEMPSVWQRK